MSNKCRRSSKRVVLKYHYVHHLVKAVGNACTILRAYLRPRKVGSYHREEPSVVASFDKVYHRRLNIAIVKQLSRFGTKVVNAKQRLALVACEQPVGRGNLNNLFGTDYLHVVHVVLAISLAKQTLVAYPFNGTLQGIEHTCFAIARHTTKHKARLHPPPLSRYVMGKGAHCLSGAIGGK